LFFDPKRYDLAKFGRFKFNKKLSLASRITGFVSADDIVDARTGEIIIAADEIIDRKTALKIQNAGINSVFLNISGKRIRVLGNNTVDINEYLDFDVTDL
jgi:DNA-directed RNA polymerase subunit beta